MSLSFVAGACSSLFCFLFSLFIICFKLQSSSVLLSIFSSFCSPPSSFLTKLILVVLYDSLFFLSLYVRSFISYSFSYIHSFSFASSISLRSNYSTFSLLPLPPCLSPSLHKAVLRHPVFSHSDHILILSFCPSSVSVHKAQHPPGFQQATRPWALYFNAVGEEGIDCKWSLLVGFYGRVCHLSPDAYQAYPSVRQ